MRKVLHIVAVLAVVAVSCRGPRMIPKDDLTDIYYDMFLLDQQVREDPELRSQADTTLVYEAIFNKYGYDTDDYLFSLETYLKDPERFARVLEDVGRRFRDQADELEKEIERLDHIAALLQAGKAPIDSLLSIFGRDSVYVGLPRVVRDSSRYGAWYRLTDYRKDTLMVPADSLKAGADTLAPEQPEPPVEEDKPLITKRLPRELLVEEEVLEEEEEL